MLKRCWDTHWAASGQVILHNKFLLFLYLSCCLWLLFGWFLCLLIYETAVFPSFETINDSFEWFKNINWLIQFFELQNRYYLDYYNYSWRCEFAIYYQYTWDTSNSFWIFLPEHFLQNHHISRYIWFTHKF